MSKTYAYEPLPTSPPDCGGSLTTSTLDCVGNSVSLVSLLEEHARNKGPESLLADFDKEQSRHESVLLSLSAIVEEEDAVGQSIQTAFHERLVTS